MDWPSFGELKTAFHERKRDRVNAFLEKKAQEFFCIATEYRDGIDSVVQDVEKPGYLLGSFKPLLEDEKVIEVFNIFAKYGRAERSSEFLTNGFKSIADIIPEEDVLETGQLIGSNSIFLQAVHGIKGVFKLDMLTALSELSERCPQDKKLGLFVALNRNGLLPHLMEKANENRIAEYFEKAFKGLDRAEIQTYLTSSETVKSITDSLDLRNAFHHRGIGNLSGILDFARGKGHENQMLP